MKTLEDAYVEGFCKAAEAYGVDPEALYKAAFPIGGITRALSRGARLARNGGTLARKANVLRAANGLRQVGPAGVRASGLFAGVGHTGEALGHASAAKGALGHAIGGIRRGLGRTIGGLSGQGFGSSLRSAGNAAGEYGRSLGGVAKGIGQDAAQIGRNAGTMARQGLTRAGRSVADAGRRGWAATADAGRRGWAATKDFGGKTNQFLKNNPTVGILGGGALGYGLSRMGGGSAGAQQAAAPQMASNP